MLLIGISVSIDFHNYQIYKNKLTKFNKPFFIFNFNLKFLLFLYKERNLQFIVKEKKN